MDPYTHDIGVRDSAVKLDLFLTNSLGDATVRGVDVMKQEQVSGHSAIGLDVFANRFIRVIGINQHKVEACATLFDKLLL